MRRGSATLIGGGLALWVAVIIVGAGQRPDQQTWIGTSGVDTVVFITACVLVLAMLGYLLTRRYTWEEPEQTVRSPWQEVAGLLVLLLAVFLWRQAGIELTLPEFDESADALLDVGAPDLQAAQSPPAETAVVELRDLLVFAFVVAGIGVAAFVFARRTAGPEVLIAASGTEAERYQEAMRTARRRLRGGGDPRSAVMLAYAELEATLNDLGHGRESSDTVREHQSRVLETLRLDERPFNILAELYDTARFSSRPIGERDRSRAADALDRALGLIGGPK